MMGSFASLAAIVMAFVPASFTKSAFWRRYSTSSRSSLRFRSALKIASDRGVKPELSGMLSWLVVSGLESRYLTISRWL